MDPTTAVAFAIIVVAVGVLGASVVWGGCSGIREWAERRGNPTLGEYRAAAVAEVGRLADNEQWVEEQADVLQGENDWRERKWFTDRFILMRNGDWMTYWYRCSKGDRPKKQLLRGSHTYDIFIGKGSDGKWYYTTFHFCVGMVVLRTEEQPTDLAAFVDNEWFSFREFDGSAANCVGKTWPRTEAQE